MMYSFNTIPEAIEDIKNGKMIIVKILSKRA